MSNFSARTAMPLLSRHGRSRSVRWRSCTKSPTRCHVDSPFTRHRGRWMIPTMGHCFPSESYAEFCRRDFARSATLECPFADAVAIDCSVTLKRLRRLAT